MPKNLKKALSASNDAVAVESSVVGLETNTNWRQSDIRELHRKEVVAAVGVLVVVVVAVDEVVVVVKVVVVVVVAVAVVDVVVMVVVKVVVVMRSL